MANREKVRALAEKYLQKNEPTAWFEDLYSAANNDTSEIPWADLKPNPHLVEWLDRTEAHHGNALVVGCGLGDDAAELNRRGYSVTAFDIAPSAIEWSRRRFPDSGISFQATDLFHPPVEWSRSYDLVFESYTIQALPQPLREKAVLAVADFVTTGGKLLVLTRGRDERDPPGDLPWPMTKTDFSPLKSAGLSLEKFEDYVDDEDPPKRRFRACYARV